MERETERPWQEITDYLVPPRDLEVAELKSLASVWQEQRSSLENADGLKKFNERLRREWAIETGLLERIYTLDRGVTQLLIERGVDASLISHQSTGGESPDHVVAVIRDHQSVIDALFDFVKGNRSLSTSYIKELHALLTRNQETTPAVDQLGRTLQVSMSHGVYKTMPNNPTRVDGTIHQYCPPEHVASEMDRLIDLHLSHVDVPPEVEAAWLHHRFTEIHPFQDGNGRVARCLATLVFLHSGWFPLVIRDVQDERTRYLDALESADRGDLMPLVKAFSAAQKKAFVQALGIADQIVRQARAELVIRAVREDLERKFHKQKEHWNNAKTLVRSLQATAKGRLHEVELELANLSPSLLPGAKFFVDEEPDGSRRDYFFRWQIVEIAKQLGYFANLSEYRAWTRLVFEGESHSEILLSFHATGNSFRGVLAISACYFRRDRTDEDQRQIVDLMPLSGEIFQVNYLESEEDARTRFREWLEEVLVKGLEAWRSNL